MKPFTVIAIVVFALVSLLHLVRYFLGWEIIVNSMTIPLWGSLLGFVIAGGLAVLGNCSRRYSTTYIHVGVLWREMK